MEEAPNWFREELERDFRGRLRIRWSIKESAWLIEQKVGRAAIAPIHISEIDDGMIRARDGYSFVLQVRPGDRAPCPRCHATLRIPVMQFAEVICQRCKKNNVTSVIRAGCWPLGDGLLEYLRKIDPERDGIRRIRDEMDNANRLREVRREREFGNYVQDVARDEIVPLSFPKVGFAGSKWNFYKET